MLFLSLSCFVLLKRRRLPTLVGIALAALTAPLYGALIALACLLPLAAANRSVLPAYPAKGATALLPPLIAVLAEGCASGLAPFALCLVPLGLLQPLWWITPKWTGFLSRAVASVHLIAKAVPCLHYLTPKSLKGSCHPAATSLMAVPAHPLSACISLFLPACHLASRFLRSSVATVALLGAFCTGFGEEDGEETVEFSFAPLYAVFACAVIVLFEVLDVHLPAHLFANGKIRFSIKRSQLVALELHFRKRCGELPVANLFEMLQEVQAAKADGINHSACPPLHQEHFRNRFLRARREPYSPPEALLLLPPARRAPGGLPKGSAASGEPRLRLPLPRQGL